jgi:fibronectin-binding autotransporter adhesin
MMRSDHLVSVNTATAGRSSMALSKLKGRLAAGISATVLTIALGAPAPAFAQDECGPTDNGFVICSPSDSQYPDGIRYVRLPEEPAGDLIVVVDPGTQIVTTSNRGINVDNFVGAALVSAGDTSITTSGDNSDGVWALSYGDSAFVTVGDVHTTGARSTGVTAVGSRNAQVNAGTILTEGNDSNGIVVLARDIAARVAVNSVTTRGDNSVGISLATESSDPGLPFVSGLIELNAGSVTTSGNNATGISYETGDPAGRSTIKVNQVTTSGDDSVGILSMGAGTSQITVDAVTTSGSRSDAIVSSKQQGNEVITAGSIETTGSDSYGILATNLSGNIDTSVETVTTSGDNSHGIYQENYDGSVALTTRAVTTSGANSNGVTSFSAFEKNTATIGTVETRGPTSIGVFLAGGRGVDATIGTVSTHGDDSAGISLIAGSAGVNVPLIRADLTADIGTVTTTGANSIGVRATALGNIDLRVGQVHTSGDGSIGVNSLLQDFGTHNVTVGKVVTEGDFAEGVLIGHNALTPDAAMNISLGEIQTSGDNSSAARIEEILSQTVVDITGNLSTSGASSNGIWVSQAQAGNLAITSHGIIATSGAGSNGISMSTLGASATINANAITTTGDNSSAIYIAAIDEHIIEEESSAFNVTAGALTTSGSNANGIDISLGEQPGGGVSGFAAGTAVAAEVTPRTNIVVRTQSITVGGEGSIGIRIGSIGAVQIEAGDTISKMAAAIDVDARETVDVSIAGRTESGGPDAVYLVGSDVTVALAATGSITSAGNALVLTANGPFVPGEGGGDDGGVSSFAAGGTVTVNNAGTIRSDNGDAIRVLGGTATIVNTGLISGRVTLADGDDQFTNKGVFEASGESDFGAGTDLFVNTGTIRMRPGRAVLAGLERFENSGAIDLKNGVAGDVLTLSGNYVGTGNASLSVEIAGNKADRLVIGGAATGSTRIVLHSVTSNDATLFTGPLTVVTTGAGSSANAFTLANSAAGFIQYGLVSDATTNSLAVTARAGAPVYRLAKVQDALAAVSLKAGEAWTSRSADLRDAGAGPRLWGQLFGGVENRNGSRTVGVPGGGATAYDLKVRQDFFGAELGYDLVQSDDSRFNFGVMGGYISSTLRFTHSADRARFDAGNVGVYAGIRSGQLFANALAKYDRYWVKASDRTLQWSDDIKGSSYGLSGEVGVRFGSDAFFAEPVATLAWQRSSLDDLTALGQTISFDDANGLRGKIGARLGGALRLGEVNVILYGGGSFRHEFAGKDGVVLHSNGVSEAVANQPLTDGGEAIAGVRIRASSLISGFIEGTASFGSSISGAGGRAGIRIRL